MEEKIYELDRDYILEVLFQAEDKLIQDLKSGISKDWNHKFSKLLAVRNEIERIRTQIAIEKYLEEKKAI